MMLFPSGIRMPPRMATAAPSTAPVSSPHLLSQHPMVVCVPRRPTVRLSVCLCAWQPVLRLPLVFLLCAISCCLSVFVQQQKRHRQAVSSEELAQRLRPGKGTVQTRLAATQDLL